MIQLSYQAAFDPYHAAFRLLRLRDALKAKIVLHVDHIRILDYFMAFPSRLEMLRVTPKHRKLRNQALAFAGAKPYEQQPDDRVLLERMRSFQAVALQGLASRELVDEKQLLARNEVSFSGRLLADPLQQRIESLNAEASPLLKFIVALATEYVLGGVGGLKERSGLLEFRYDTV